MKIEILGTGCAKCKRLYENALAAVSESGVEAEIIKVEAIEKIMSYGVMSTPALVIDGEVKSAGAISSPAEIKNFIQKK